MKEYKIILVADFDYTLFLDFEQNPRGYSQNEVAQFSVRKGEQHFRVASNNPLVYWERVLLIEYDKVISVSFKDLIQDVQHNYSSRFAFGAGK